MGWQKADKNAEQLAKKRQSKSKISSKIKIKFVLFLLNHLGKSIMTSALDSGWNIFFEFCGNQGSKVARGCHRLNPDPQIPSQMPRPLGHTWRPFIF